MKKYILSETQYRNIRKYLIESKLKSYTYDWDDNILRMPTKVSIEKNENGKWVPIKVSTEEFAHLRSDPQYRITPNSFVDFTDNQSFLADAEKAIHNGSFAPSYEKFIKSLINAEHFAINTARGHSPETLKKGVKLLIKMVLSDDEKRMMFENIKKELLPNLTKGLNFNQMIDLFLDERGEFYPVSSEEFGKEFGLEVKGGASNPEHAKKVALEDKLKNFLNDPKTKNAIKKGIEVSFGFSDDDKKNVKAAEDFFRHELSIMYPEVRFVIYDTSEGGNKKIVIEKE
jgi:hypothetical protein